MSVYEESGFQFDFTSAIDSSIHDKDLPHDGNTFWPGVDFRVVESQREVWIEVKSWSFSRIHDKVERRTAQRDFAQKLVKDATDEFRDEIVAKFFGTTSYLVWSGISVPPAVTYIVFLEPPNRGSRALLGPFQDRLRDQFKNAQARPWGKRITYRVVDMAGFHELFPNFLVKRS
jgi:hypothetical protein